MSYYCGAAPFMRLTEEREEKQQGPGWGKKKQNQFRKLPWRTLPGEGLWVGTSTTLRELGSALQLCCIEAAVQLWCY